MLDARGYERELLPLLGQAAAYARSLLRNQHDADDAIQQAALRAWERIDQYDEQRPFKSWWFAILRNCCLDLHRRAKAQPTQALDRVDPPDHRAANTFDWRTLDAGLATLSTAHQEILRLKYYGAFNYAEISDMLGIPIGTVMSRLHLARRALAAKMCKEDR